jgi:hypothetical protein
LKMPSPEIGFPAGAAVLGGLLSSQGQRSAASTQADAANRAIDLQAQQRREDIARLQPRLDVGNNALAQMQGGAFAQPAAFTYDPSKYTQSAANKFLTDAGNKNAQALLASQGRMFSGGALKAISDYNRNAASVGEKDYYQRALDEYNANVARSNTGYNRLAGLADVGQTAGTQIGTAGQNYATNVGNLTGQAGQATAAGQLGMGNTYNSMLGTMASSYQNQNNFDRFLASLRQPNANYESRMGVNFLSPNAYD